MLRWLRKLLALRAYRRKLGPLLRERYGRARFYSVAQVRTTVGLGGFSTEYICYAYAGYCEPADFAQHHAEIGQTCDWASMREELAGHHPGAAEHHVGFESDHHHGGDHSGFDHHDHGGGFDGGHHGGGFDGGHH
jgi:hypothetical protein